MSTDKNMAIHNLGLPDQRPPLIECHNARK